ncbi:MAG: hypothetical protein Q8N77_01625 [Nanoarchaeota archaeon]|nr:hypothetical protein [Nanoarchaeota archaeon]
MITNQRIEVLRIISKKLEGKNINWCLIGSTNLALQGIEIEPNDIDIMADKQGAYEIGELLGEYETRPVQYKEAGTFAGYKGKFKINNIEIEVIGELKIKNVYRPIGGHIVMVKIDSLAIPCMDLKSEYEAYQKLGRKEKAELIRQKLKTIP